MLLTGMISDETGCLYGTTEDGRDIPLSVPYANAVVGRSKFDNDSDLNMARAERSLKRRARIDTGNYYKISEGQHSKNGKIYFIPYVVFIK